jgi:hypothetical protein
MASLELAPIDEMPETESLIREPVSLMPGERGQRRAGVPRPRDRGCTGTPKRELAGGAQLSNSPR